MDETVFRDADTVTVDDALRHLKRLLTASVVNRYLSRNIQAAINDANESGDSSAVEDTAIRARVAALAFVDAEVQRLVEDAADSLTRLWLTTKAHDIANLPDSRKPTYEAVQNMARESERDVVEIKTDELVDSVDTDMNPLPTEKKHLLSLADGEYPLERKMANNRWERATIKCELATGTLEGWYRNPSAAGKNSLRIVHEAGGVWRSVQPDFVFVHRIDGKLRPSIVDPHGAHLGDSAPKLKALAEYADEYGSLFERIVAVGIETDGALQGLDLKSPSVRRAVYESPADADSIKRLYETHATKYSDIPEGP